MGLIDNENEKIVDIAIPEIQKKRYRINGDNSKILEINTADPNVMTRLRKGYNDLIKLAEELGNFKYNEDDEDGADKLAADMEDLDNRMKERLDYIFDANVSEVTAGSASMYSLNNGKFRFEDVIESIGNLYAQNFNDEFEAMRTRTAKHTNKYTKKKRS